jgi:hypothetical protein
VKPDAASLPPVLILASGFLLLCAIAVVAAHPESILGTGAEGPDADENVECPGAGPTPDVSSASPAPPCGTAAPP